jgi:LacI family gluconate utilization system Gnt-I transcriptional repressor
MVRKRVSEGKTRMGETKPPRTPVNQRDVAYEAGVSEMTVSRVMRGKGDVSEKVRNHVRSVARRMGYVPNRIAGGLASSRVNLVAVIVPSMSNMVFPEVMAGVSEGLKGSGLQSVMGLTKYDADHEEEVVYKMLSWRPSGVILAGLDHTEATQTMLTRAGVPVVEVMDSDGDGIGSLVGISHKAAGRDMGREVIKAGYKRIGFIGGGLPLDRRAQNRLDSFEAAVGDGGGQIVARAHYDGNSALAKGRDLAAQLLAETPDLDFIYCSSDLISAGALMHCIAAGLSVPGDIGLAGFNGLSLLDGLPVKLATTDACRRETGLKAAELILAQLKDASQKSSRIELTPQIELGQSIIRT